MADAPFVINPASVFVSDVNWNQSPQRSVGPNIDTQNPYYLSRPLPNTIASLLGTGQVDLAPHSIYRGTLQADVIIGVASVFTETHLLYLRGTSSGVLTTVDITDQNKLGFAINDGFTLVGGSPDGVAYGAGARLLLKLTWDSFLGTVSFTVNGAAYGGTVLWNMPGGQQPWRQTGTFNALGVGLMPSDEVSSEFTGTIVKAWYTS
jgi:hypothetical protein